MSIFSKISREFKKVVPKSVRDIGKVVIGAIVPPVGAAIIAADKLGRVAQGFKSIKAGAPITLGGGIEQATGLPRIITPDFSAPVTNMSMFGGMLGALPAIGRAAGAVIPGVGRAAGRAVAIGRRFLNTPGGKWTKKAIRDAGLVVSGGLVFDAAGNLLGSVSRRRMNPLNSRALRRSIRRVKAARGICRDVESMLPKKRSAPACAPRGKRC